MKLLACRQCDLVHEIPWLDNRATARCSRCNAVLFRSHSDTFNCTIAWTLSALVLFLVAINFPFLGITAKGVERHTGLMTGIYEIYGQEMTGLAILVMLTCVIAPTIQMTEAIQSNVENLTPRS